MLLTVTSSSLPPSSEPPFLPVSNEDTDLCPAFLLSGSEDKAAVWEQALKTGRGHFAPTELLSWLYLSQGPGPASCWCWDVELTCISPTMAQAWVMVGCQWPLPMERDPPLTAPYPPLGHYGFSLPGSLGIRQALSEAPGRLVSSFWEQLALCSLLSQGLVPSRLSLRGWRDSSCSDEFPRQQLEDGFIRA